VTKEFTCFLIDDDIDDQEIFLSVLEEFDPSIRCYTAANGQEAIHKLTSEGVKPDLIFLDLNMPLMNGKQFLKACSSLDGCKEIPVIILTTSSDKKSIEETKQLGAKDYITKPDKFSAWGTIIKEKLNVYRWKPNP
jgi:CheY-like chemotaxis protein